MLLKSKKFWSYESCQSFELKQEVIDNYKLKGRIYEDINYFYDLIGVNAHPGLKVPHGREHTEPNSISIVNVQVDINTLKILFTILPNSKIVTLKFCSNGFDIDNMDYLINSLITRPNNIYNFVFEWNHTVRFDGTEYSFQNITNDSHIAEKMAHAQSLICKLVVDTKLEALCLRGNYFGDETAIHILEGLKTNQNLRVINLFKNNLTSKCISALCGMLECNKHLEEINLGANYFEDGDLDYLKNFLGKFPMTAEEVEVHNKKVKERDLILQKNVKLKIQKKSEEHVPMIDEVVLIGDVYYTNKNTKIRNLNLMQNSFTEKSIDSVLYILDTNADLLLTMDGSVFNKSQREFFADPYGKYGNRIYLTK